MVTKLRPVKVRILHYNIYLRIYNILHVFKKIKNTVYILYLFIYLTYNGQWPNSIVNLQVQKYKL